MALPKDPRPVFDARMVIHATLTGVMAWMAAILVLPGDTFHTSSNWDQLARIGTEDHWATVFWFVASVGLAGMTTRSRLARLLSVLALATTFGAVAILFLIANPYGVGSGVLIGLALQGYYLAWRRAHAGF